MLLFGQRSIKLFSQLGLAGQRFFAQSTARQEVNDGAAIVVVAGVVAIVVTKTQFQKWNGPMGMPFVMPEFEWMLQYHDFRL